MIKETEFSHSLNKPTIVRTSNLTTTKYLCKIEAEFEPREIKSDSNTQ